LRAFLVKFVEKNLFGKGVEELTEENVHMRVELQKQGQMKAVATLAAGMAHEIKNPLTAIKTFTEYLPSKHHDPEFIQHFTKIVGAEIDRIDGTVRQLLEFSKPSPLQLESVDLHELMGETLSFLNGEFIKHQVQVSRNFEASKSTINGDKKQLKQVFLNLFLNAIQAMPNGGALTVSTSYRLSPNSYLLITISDTGIGIPKENLKHIFEPFFTTKEGGTGLGLSIVHGIVKEHDGNITVESGRDQGTSFNIKFNRLI
jgi:signal transduction histidine kinase